MLTRNTDAEVENQAEREAEYQQLKLALHLAQVDRSRYAEEMNVAMIKMRNNIDKLENENAELLDKIRLVDNQANQLRDQRICEDLVNLAENKDWLHQQISLEKARHSDLDAKICGVEKKLAEMRLKAGGSSGAQEVMNHARNRVTTMESRLVYTLKTYNESVGKNMALRDEIDTIRLQRGKFDYIYRRLEHTLSKQRAAIKRLIEATSMAYEQREDASQKTQQLTEKAEKDAQQHNNEMKELVRLIDHDRKLKHFMRVKATERQEDPQLTAWKAKRIQEADDRRAEVEKLVERYEQAFDRMLELMQENTTDNLVESFLQKEDRNFALFNYVSETNAEIERLNEDNEKLANEIGNYQDWMSHVVGGHREQLVEWQSANDKTRERQLSTEARLGGTKEILDMVCQQVVELVTKLNCDTTLLTRRLASSDGVTHANLLDYLTLIEDRVNKLLLVRQFIAVNDPEAPYVAKSVLIGSNLVPSSSTLPTMHPPNLNEDFDEQTELSVLKPFSREELHRRVVSLVRKKEQEARSSQLTAIPMPKNIK